MIRFSSDAPARVARPETYASVSDLRDLVFGFEIPEPPDVQIVVVDEEAGSRERIATYFTTLGHRVRAFGDGESAIDHLRAHPPHVLICADAMPRTSGRAIARVARALDPDVVVILLSSASQRPAPGDGDGERVVLKPVKLDDLGREVQGRYLRRAAQHHHRAMVQWMRGSIERNAAAIREVTLGSLTSLANAMDARSPHFRGHSTAVAEISAGVARKLGLNAEQVESIWTAGLLHDIGMIGIPDGLLDKPTRLSDEEERLVRAHPAVGASILSPMEHLGSVIDYVREHHERLDGSGYPDGKRAGEITLGGQIVGIAEAWTGLVEKRAYRDARTPQEAASVLREHVGAWFTPDVTEALVDVEIGAAV